MLTSLCCVSRCYHLLCFCWVLAGKCFRVNVPAVINYKPLTQEAHGSPSLSFTHVWTTSMAEWLRRPPRERKISGSNPARDRIFSGLSHTSDLKIGTPMAALPGTWRYRVSTGTGRPDVSILWLGEVEGLICNFYLSVAARKLVCADLSWDTLACCQDVKQPTNNNNPFYSRGWWGVSLILFPTLCVTAVIKYQHKSDMGGLFLVRDSTVSSTDFSLSLTSAGRTYHFQIQEIKEGYFQIHDGPLIHGWICL